MKPCTLILCALVLLLDLLASSQGATIEAVGVLGNSGEVGKGLIRVSRFAPSGVALDGDLTLWVSGGDGINRVGLDGHLIERFSLEPQESYVDSGTFAVLRGKLYFFGRLPEGGIALFALPMRPGATAWALPVDLPQRRCRLASQPLDGKLVIAAELPEDESPATGVYFLSPPEASGLQGRGTRQSVPIERAFELECDHLQGIAVDDDRDVIYVGARFERVKGAPVGSKVFGITLVRPDGEGISAAFPVRCTLQPATPTEFRGVVSLAGGALWDTAWYGFLARLDLGGLGTPGRIVAWQHELSYPTQVLEIGGSTSRLKGQAQGSRANAGIGTAVHPRQLFCVTTHVPDAFYLLRWDGEKQCASFARRIGCLAEINSLGMSQDGWVSVGTERTQLWWRWEDAADAPPHKAGLFFAVTPQFFSGDRFFAFATRVSWDNFKKRAIVPAIFTPRPCGRNEASRAGGKLPMKKPVGLSVQLAPGKDVGTLFVTDGETKQIMRIGFSTANLDPRGDKWEAVRLENEALRAPTDIAALTDGRLLLADGGRVLLLDPQENGYRVQWQFERWGRGPHQRFGKELRMAVGGPWMLLSDTQRHRVVWVDWMQRKVLAQFGETDKRGDDAEHLDAPTLVALRGTRALIADAGNQRILKLQLQP